VRDVISAASVNADGPGTLTVLNAAGVPTTIGWDAVHAWARRLATVFAEEGVGPGHRVGLLADTSVDLVVAVQAAWLAGASITMLPAPVHTVDAGYLQNLRRIARDARLTLLVVDRGFEPVGRALRGEVAGASLDALMSRTIAAQPAPVVAPELHGLAVLQYTSGSTREPRGVPVTHRHLAANLSAIVDATAHHPGTRMFSWLPLYHDMGLIGYLALPMSTGCSLILQSPRTFAARPASWLEGVSRYRATSTAAPNFGYALAARSLAGTVERDLDLSSLELMLCGGEPISAATIDAFAAAAGRYGLPTGSLTAAYGLAEATLAVTIGRPGNGMSVDIIDPDVQEADGYARAPRRPDRMRRLTRLGSPMAGTTVRVVDRHGDPLPERRIGEVEVCGPAVVGHYWGEPVPESPWWPTGDVGYLAEGELVLCGRAKDVLFAAGRNVFPQDVEWLASTVAGVRTGNVAAFGIPGDTGDRLVVVVESRAGAQQSIVDDVVAEVVAGTGLRPAEVVVLAPGHLPKTSSGKLRRAETRERYLAGWLGGRPVPDPHNAMEEQRI
jgi:fatty-acyl-CoA synthase